MIKRNVGTVELSDNMLKGIYREYEIYLEGKSEEESDELYKIAKLFQLFDIRSECQIIKGRTMLQFNKIDFNKMISYLVDLIKIK